MKGHPLLTAFIVGIIAYGCYYVLKKVAAAKGAQDYLNPSFWTLGRPWRITAVHRFDPSDDPSGYTATKFATPEDWQRLIHVQSAFGNLRQTIRPVNESDFLIVFVEVGGKEKYIHFKAR